MDPVVQGWFCSGHEAGVRSNIEFRFGQSGICAVRRLCADLVGVGVCAVLLAFGEWWWYTTRRWSR